jgi:hypothetical protein
MFGNFIGDLLFGGFVIIMVVILINDQENAVKLTKGGVEAYTGGVKELASIR